MVVDFLDLRLEENSKVAMRRVNHLKYMRRLNAGRHKYASLFLAVGLFATSVLSPNETVVSHRMQPQSADYFNRPPPSVPAEARREMETRLDEARANSKARPNDAEASIWVGRRLAYLGRFREAIDWYTEAIRKFPNDARLYRHRGHRYITTRQFAPAIADLNRAAQLTKGKPDQIEPDGQPNSRNIPTSTLQFNIWYHLGLAYYLTGNNQAALASYRECLRVSKSPDRLVATSHWLYMTLRRLGQTREAEKVLVPITHQMDIIENGSYHRLLLMYKGRIFAEALEGEALREGSSAGSYSILYGVGNWHLYNGRKDAATRIFQQMLTGDQWTSFGYIAAESDMKRLRM
jgi:tetratricopeptide (TPR) repeat protein